MSSKLSECIFLQKKNAERQWVTRYEVNILNKNKIDADMEGQN